MSLNVVVCLGFCCVSCGRRVSLLRSTDRANEDLLPEIVVSRCVCGSERIVDMKELQTLDIWREEIPKGLREENRRLDEAGL
jgi:hypothetical protein